MPETRWKGYIKDYSGSTMMQCKIHKGIDYENISNTIKMQRDFIVQKIHQIINKKIYAQLDFVGPEFAGKDYDFNEIQGLLEAGWTKKDYESAKGTEEKSFEQ